MLPRCGSKERHIYIYISAYKEEGKREEEEEREIYFSIGDTWALKGRNRGGGIPFSLFRVLRQSARFDLEMRFASRRARDLYSAAKRMNPAVPRCPLFPVFPGRRREKNDGDANRPRTARHILIKLPRGFPRRSFAPSKLALSLCLSLSLSLSLDLFPLLIFTSAYARRVDI